MYVDDMGGFCDRLKYHMISFMKDIKLKITPRDQRRKTIKTVSVLGDTSLYDLAEKIVGEYKIDFGHCFGFFGDVKSNFYLRSKEKYELFTDLIEEGQDLEPTGALSVKKTKVKDVWKNTGDKMLFLFDYGDSLEWTVESI
jgi:hypothetical protein